MKTKELLDILKIMEFVNKSTQFPILQNVQYKNGYLNVTDNETFVSVKLDLGQDFHCNLSDLIKNLNIMDNSDFSISIVYSELFLKTEKEDFSLPVLETEEFPEPGTFNSEKIVPENRYTFNKPKKLFDNLLKCARLEPSSYQMSGIYFNGSDLVATDTEILTIMNSEDNNFTAGKSKFIAPSKFIQTINKFNPDCVKLSNSENTNSEKILQATFEYNGFPVTVSSKTLDGIFPDYSKAIPKTDGFIKFKNKPVRTKLKKMKNLLEGASFRMHLNSKMVINAKSFSSHFEIEKQGADIEFGFNPENFGKALDVYQDADVTMTYFDRRRPVILEKGKSKILVMPVLVRE